MKLAITGALGHIGSRFIHSLRPGDYTRVALLDDLSTQRYCSLFNLPPDVPFRFAEVDICTANLVSLFQGVDVVVHLAAITDATSSFDCADRVEHVNFEGAERVARACVATGSRMIFFSTTSVYGTQEMVVDEQCAGEDLKPQSPYATSKLKAERMLQGLGQAEGLRFIICRFGTIFGTSIGMRFHTAINKFCWQACMGQPLSVWRTALHQKRPYLDLKDAVRALDFIIKTDRFDKQVYNVLTTNATVGEIVEAIRRHVPDTRIEYVDSRIMNQLSYEVSCDKFKSLGFEFQGSLTQGVHESIQLIRGMRQAEEMDQ
jgi:nucleoside-diphosphate-sugar epimerase